MDYHEKKFSVSPQERRQQEKIRTERTHNLLRAFIQLAINESAHNIEEHVLRLHTRDISTVVFGGRPHYTLFDETQFLSVQAFQNIATELLHQNQRISFDDAGTYNRRIKIILHSSRELGQVFTYKNYIEANHLINTGRRNDVKRAGKSGKTLVLIIDSKSGIVEEIRGMINGTHPIPEDVDGYAPEIITAFLER
ncbi:MAG: hypothetical protein BGO76_05830 [Caedibacter sp. 38-128]|nr:hypothetical protein [Holosporales bacterium]OJX03565.1 MAG: hypothetical protein BGO76_05830 [Caedibacter sp. 38-128]